MTGNITGHLTVSGRLSLPPAQVSHSLQIGAALNTRRSLIYIPRLSTARPADWLTKLLFDWSHSVFFF